MTLRTERNSWGVGQFLLAAVLAGSVVFLWRNLTADGPPGAANRSLPAAGLAAALLAGWFGHSSYPRVHNFKVYAVNIGVAVVSLAAVVLLFLVPRILGTEEQTFISATLLLSYISLLFVFTVTVIVPEYLSYRATRRYTFLVVGIIIVWYLLGLGLPIVRRFLAYQLEAISHVQSMAFWGLSSVAAAVLFLSLFVEAHSFGIGGIHAGAVLLLAIGWLTPGSDVLLHTMVVTALPILVALGTLVHWYQRLENRASYDPLLRIYNRGWCDRVLNEQSRVDVRPPFVIALLDLDHFKAVNDTYGHDAGDAVLREAAQRIRGTVLPHGTVGRYGGEELILFLPQYDEESARELLETVRTALEGGPVTHRSGGSTLSIPVTVSIGFALRTERDQPLSSVVKAADQALYTAKEGGRNQVRLGRLRRRDG